MPHIRLHTSRRVIVSAWIVSVILTLSVGVRAAQAQQNGTQALRIVELFTSHGCSSCPPADRLLGQLIQDDPNVVALEFHVDYWNDLVYGGGNWVDPFSHRDWTERQRAYYDAKLSGRRGVYTPQMIVNGRYAAVGSDVRRVGMALADRAHASASVSVQRVDGDYEVAVQTSNPEAHGADVLLVRFLRRATTDVTAGENRHMMITNHHIVESIQRLGSVSNDSVYRYQFATVSAARGCAVIVQAPDTRAIYGASNCP